MIKMAGKNQNMAPMWKNLMKHVDLDEPTSFLVHVYEITIEEHTKMFESHYFLEQLKNYCCERTLAQKQ